MASAGPSKSKAVSSKAINGLKAQLAHQRAGVREEPKAKKGLNLKGGIVLKSNKGIESRQEADAAALRATKREAEFIKGNLERKKKTYKRLGRGMTGGLTEEQIAALPFDVDQKMEETSDSSGEESGSDSESVSSEAMTEIQDEFGRTLRVKRSEVPRHLRARQAQIDDGDVIRGRGIQMHHNPVYTPDEDRRNKIRELAKETPLEQHWDPTGDNRQKGAGYMKLGKTKEEREKNLAALNARRQETVRKRQEAGADTQEAASVIATASLKRKERNEERLGLMTAKRRKVDTAKDAMDFLADMEVELAQRM